MSDTIDDGNTVVKGKNIIIATGSDFKSLPGSLPLMKRKLYLLLVLRLCNRFQRNLWSLRQAILDMRWAQCGPGLVKKSLSSSLLQILSQAWMGKLASNFNVYLRSRG